MNRRAFVSVAGLGITAIGVMLIDFVGFDFSDGAWGKPELLSRLCNDSGLRALGQEYMKLYPAEGSREVLMTQLCGRPFDSQRLGRKEVRSIQQRLKYDIKRDFIAGRSVILGGWVLSLTEARQCALFSILNS